MSSSNHTDYYYNEVRVRSVPEKMKIELKNISDHTGKTISALMRPKIRELIDSYPEHYREPKQNYDD